MPQLTSGSTVSCVTNKLMVNVCCWSQGKHKRANLLHLSLAGRKSESHESTLPIGFVNMKCRSTLMLGDRWQAECQAVMMSRFQYLNHKWVLKKSLTSLGLSDNHYIISSPEWHQFMSGLSSSLNSGVLEWRYHSSAFRMLTTWSQAWNVAINWHYMD